MSANIFKYINEQYEKKGGAIDILCDYIKIPNQSPLFDPEWSTNGYMDQAVKLLTSWANQQEINNMKLEVVQVDGRTPLIYIEVLSNCGDNDNTILMYGHLDKQPPMTEFWSDGLGPLLPVRKKDEVGDKLYGRGGADDGYAIFAAITAIGALQKHNINHSRCVIVIEACEESGSPDLPFYMDHLANKIGSPSLIICLDSGCGNYERLWLTTSLRGVAVGTLSVSTITEGVHSGLSSGIVPPSFRILRQLLSRIEDETSGKLLDVLYANVPEEHVKFCEDAGKTLDKLLYSEFPWKSNNVQPMSNDLTELALNRSWRPSLVVTGVDGLPTLTSAGNVMRPITAVKLSIRLPPSLNPEEPLKRVKEVLEANPPYNADVSFTLDKTAQGWVAPSMDDWLMQSVQTASKDFYDGKDARFIGEGGSIPFMGFLHKKFPQAQFAIMGVLGPKSNAHGPNEFLHLDMAKRITAVVASITADFEKHVSVKRQKV